VKGAAAFEKDTFTAVTEARAQVGQVSGEALKKITEDPAAFEKFSRAQDALSSALSRLMVVVEKYPDLKATENFRELQAQLEGTENRITVARKRYIEAVQKYNVVVRSFPSNLTAKMFGFPIRPNFTVENEKELSTPPKVDFGTTTGSPH
jgi:LemA protein